MATHDEGNDANTEKRLRIACSCPPISGHMNHLVSLSEALAARKNNEVFLLTFPYAIKKIESRCEAVGIKTVGLYVGEGFDSEEALLDWKKPKLFFPSLADHFETSYKETLDSINPDIIVCDFACLASQNYAISQNIPLVINVAGPIDMAWDICNPVINVHNNRFTFAAGGLFVSYAGFELTKLLLWLNVVDLGRYCDGVRRAITCGNSMVLVHSFWGLEKAQYLLHPNIIPIGPIEKVPSKAPDFSQSHLELHSFLHTARASQRKILLVTTGSMVLLEKWMVQLFWEAFEKLSDDKMSIVWSLKKDRQAFLSKEQLQHHAFHFSTWLPQPALLASDLVDGVLTHCGWNGTVECISGGKPVVALPFFADQINNTKLLLNAGCATKVAAIPMFNIDLTGQSAYVPPTNTDLGWLDLRERLRRFTKCKLTVEGLVEGCQKIMKDPRYMQKAKKLQALSSGPGKGREFACDLIEHAGHHGLRHLSESGDGDNNLPRPATIARRLSGHRPLLVTLVMLALLGWALTKIYPLLLGLVAGSDF